jgi:hypothetical protein
LACNLWHSHTSASAHLSIRTALDPAPPCLLPFQGFESVSDLAGSLAKIETRAPWDGGEGTVEAADEFDLADLMGDDDKKAEL